MAKEKNYNLSEEGKRKKLLNLGRYILRGRVMIDETKKLISKKLKGIKRSEETKKKMSKGQKGKIFTKETRKKMSETHKKINSGWWFKGKKKSPEHRKKLKEYALRGLLSQQRMKEPTSIENKLYKELKRRGLLFETQKLINGRFLVDAYIPSLNLVIEADGDYWHNLERVQKKDKAENAYLTKCGYKLLRLPEHEINDGSFKEKLN